MNKIRVAAVGLGWVALHRHLPVLEKSEDFTVAGVIDRAPGAAKRVAAERGYRHFAETGRLADVDWIESVDAVTVATAPMSHHSIISQALRLGKHVLTEKPFAMTLAEGEELVRMAAASELKLGIVHNFQFARSTKRLLEEIQNGRLGSIRAVNAVQFGNPGRRLPKWYEQLPLGLFYDESPHLLYLLRLVAGPLRLSRSIVFPSSTGLRTPARIDAFLESDAVPGPVTLHCNFESPVSEWYLMVFGEHRLGIVDVFRDIYISVPNDGQHTTSTVLRTSLSTFGQHFWQHFVSGLPHLTGRLRYGNTELFQRFAAAIRGADDAFLPINGESALSILRLQHAIIENQETTSRPLHEVLR